MPVRRRFLALAALLAFAPVAAAATEHRGVATASCPDTTYVAPTGLAISASTPGVTIFLEPIHWYPVTGGTAAQIYASMEQCRPAAIAPYTGKTNNWVNYRYTSAVNSRGQCSVGAVAVGVQSTMVLPSWTPSTNSTPELAKEWQTFIDALYTHEGGHVDRAISGARQLYADLTNVGPGPCSTLTARTSAVFSRDNAAIEQAQFAYDAQTDHGRTQGAVLGGTSSGG